MNALFTKRLPACLSGRVYQHGTCNTGCHKMYRRKTVVDTVG